MAIHSSVLAWRIPGIKEPGGLPFMGQHRVGHNWNELAVAVAFILLLLIFSLYLYPLLLYQVCQCGPLWVISCLGLCESWPWIVASFSDLANWKILVILSSKEVSILFSLSLPSGTHIIWILTCLILFWRSVCKFSFFSFFAFSLSDFHNCFLIP